LANVTAAGAPADVIKYWEDTLEDIQIRIEEANEEMTSTWVEALQAASDAYDNSVQIAIEKMQSALSVFNNLDEIESAYDRAEEISERYLDDFEKVYELNKLSKNIAKDINEISSQYGKNKMAELLEEINELESSNAQIS
jgi:ribosomal protein S17E